MQGKEERRGRDHGGDGGTNASSRGWERPKGGEGSGSQA